jgi:hypothetical protein
MTLANKEKSSCRPQSKTSTKFFFSRKLVSQHHLPEPDCKVKTARPDQQESRFIHSSSSSSLCCYSYHPQRLVNGLWCIFSFYRAGTKCLNFSLFVWTSFGSFRISIQCFSIASFVCVTCLLEYLRREGKTPKIKAFGWMHASHISGHALTVPVGSWVSVDGSHVMSTPMF